MARLYIAILVVHYWTELNRVNFNLLCQLCSTISCQFTTIYTLNLNTLHISCTHHSQSLTMTTNKHYAISVTENINNNSCKIGKITIHHFSTPNTIAINRTKRFYFFFFCSKHKKPSLHFHTIIKVDEWKFNILPFFFLKL